MNGTSYGTSNSGKPYSSAASRIASGIVGVGEAGAEPEPGQPVAGQPRDVLALRLGPFELQTGGQQQLAAGQPRRRIDDLGDVDPADGVVHARLARDEADLEVAEEVTEGEHRFVTERRESYADSYNLTAAVSRRNHYARAMLAHDRTGSGPPLRAPPWPRLVQGDVAARDAVARARPRRDRRRPAGLRRVGARRGDRRGAGRRPSPRSPATSVSSAGTWRATRWAAASRSSSRRRAACASACAISPDRGSSGTTVSGRTRARC